MPCLKIGQVGTQNGPILSNRAQYDHVGALNYQIMAKLQDSGDKDMQSGVKFYPSLPLSFNGKS